MQKAQPKFVEHCGKQILYLDFSKMNKNDIPSFMDSILRFLEGYPQNSQLFLVNVYQMDFDRQTISQFTDFSNHSRKYSLATAIVGIDPIKKVLYEAALSLSGSHSKNIRMWINNRNEEAAMDWLVSL